MGKAFAPAKINLTLHVTGQRSDGYHLLDSLVVFADVGDRITVETAPDLSLAITGPMSHGVPVDGRNLVLQAARSMRVANVAIHLEKHLPAAAGIGGGSSDAAAAMREMARLTGRNLPPDNGLSLGADVPICLLARPCRMQGIGEAVTEVPGIPRLFLVLVNPGIEVLTGEIFQKLKRRDNPPMPADLPRWPDAPSLATWLATQRNDLEPAARAVAPEVGVALRAIGATDGCLLARMSGSGATCFGLYADKQTAHAAAASIQGGHPGWWCRAATSYARSARSEDLVEP